MFPLDKNRPSKNQAGQPDLVPPLLSLTTCMCNVSLLELKSEPVRVHYLAANSPPFIRCNGEGDGQCSLCRLGWPATSRELLLVYDLCHDRLWAAALPGHLKETLFAAAAALPEHQRNFYITWDGSEYRVDKDFRPQVSDFTLTREERERALELLSEGAIDLAGAIPRLSNGAMLRLPAVMLAAMSLGVEGLSQAHIDLGDETTVHW